MGINQFIPNPIYPSHVQFFKVIFFRMATTTEYPLDFYPEGAILLDVPEKYRSILKAHNEYLFNITTYPIHDTNED